MRVCTEREREREGERESQDSKDSAGMTAIAALACLKVMQLGNSLLNVLADLLGSRKITYFHPHVKLKPNQKLLGLVVDKHDWNTEEESEEDLRSIG